LTNRLALVVAVALGIISIIGIRTYVLRIEKQHRIELQPVDVYVAARDLVPGMTFGREDLEVRQFPRSVINEAFQTSRITDENTVINDIVTADVKAGQVLQTYHFSSERSGVSRHKLEGKFGKDDRAMTIQIGKVSGVGGMLKPGDYVDLLLTMPFTGRGGARVVTYTQMQNVLILATDSVTNPADPRAGNGYSSLTFRLSPAQCNTLKYCLDSGGALTTTYVQPGTPTSEATDPVTNDIIYRAVESDLIKKLR
jgi:pilus assembly protein CpaB